MSEQSRCANWSEWQFGVVAAVREQFRELFHDVHGNDFDWDAWRPFFDAGLGPSTAVQQALSAHIVAPRSGRMELEVD